VRTLDLVDADSGVDFGSGIHLDAHVAGDGDRVALVLPGAERAVENAAFVSALANDFTVIAPSHPGFGHSPRPDWCTSVDDLAGIYCDWLQASQMSDVTLIGLQFGGWVALEMVARRSAWVSRLVLVDSLGVKLGGPLDREIADLFALSHHDLEARLYADHRFGLGDLGGASESDVLEMARNDEALAIYGWEPFMHNPGLGRALPGIDIPTTVIWGGQDGIVTPDYGRGIADRIPGATFESIDGGAHRVQVECPDQVARLILAPTH
jgi:pimeloyl-ACP methyl ester carboxylesterase